MREKESHLSDTEELIVGLSYLADIFGHMNEVSFDSRHHLALWMVLKNEGFLTKLFLWKRRVRADNYANFPLLEQVLLQSESKSDNDLSIFCNRYS